MVLGMGVPSTMNNRAKTVSAVAAAVVLSGFLVGCTAQQPGFVTPGPGAGPVLERTVSADARAVLEAFKDRALV